ncbi:hypothetical protein [Bradyrhizobium sp. B117]|uniref:hypothetical protein n=1 Tax=Bradyrhizobium sp. B117 TaxID=3140246 RepID=UPI003183916F
MTSSFQKQASEKRTASATGAATDHVIRCPHSNSAASVEAQEDAGCDEFYHGVRWTEVSLLQALRQLEEQDGDISATLFDQNGVTPSAYYFTKRFGSLTNAKDPGALSAGGRSRI